VSHDALLDAVAESPNDDGPRQVFADWLLQQADEVMRARAAFTSRSPAPLPDRASSRHAWRRCTIATRKPGSDRPEDGRWSTLEIRWTNVRTEAGDDDRPKLRDEVIRTLEQLPPGRRTRTTLVGPATARFDVARWRTRVITALRSQVEITIDRAP